MARYFRLVTPVLRWEVEAEGDPPAISLTSDHLEPRARTVSHMYSLGVAFGRFRRLTAGEFRFAEVVLAMNRPRDEGRLRVFFDCPIRYTNREVTTVRLPSNVWHMPLVRHEPALTRVLERHAQDLVSQLGDPEDPLAPIRDAIAASLAEGPRLEDIAKRVAMSPRTLQRRLRQAGTTFQGLVDEARQRVAQGYLNDKALTIGEVAYLLGYSEPSAFVRAFKRWTGRTPRQFRAQAS
jgi:AraC-like DNA-binding protein